MLEELLLAMSHRSRNSAVVPDGDERKPSQNAGDGDHVGDRIRFGLIQLLRPALARLPPPRGGAPAGQKMYTVCRQFDWFA